MHSVASFRASGSVIEIMQNVWLGHALLGVYVLLQFEPASPKCHSV